MTNNERKQLQDLMSSQGWEVLEKYMEEYLNNFKSDTIRKATEFDTIWEASNLEGGKYHLTNFFAQAEKEARKYGT